MNRKEARRVYVMERVVSGELTVREGAQYLGLSERQVKRLKKGMKEVGVAALAHGNRGRTPKHAIPHDTKDLVASLAMGIYRGASSEHMAELLAEHQGIRISSKSVGRILKERGIISPQKRRRGHRSRERAKKEGLLVQMDASPYRWLGGETELSLHGAIDDATGKVLSLYLRPTEDLNGYLNVLYQVALKYGIPRSLYTDGHTIFFSPKKDKLTVEEELLGKKVALTQLGRVLDELGITHIHARSPQAKGRIERLWGTLQSRLAVELRVQGISDLNQANAFLPGFIERFNARFQVEPEDPEPAYLPSPGREALEAIICAKETRVATGSVLSYQGETYCLMQGEKMLTLPQKARVEILLHLDGSIDAQYNQKRYELSPFKRPPKRQEMAPPKPKGHKPKPDHPWRQYGLPKRQYDPVEDYFRKHERQHINPGGWRPPEVG